MSQAALTGKASFLATRALLAVLEGGFIPDLVLWLSYFYTGRELPIRLSFFWTALSITTIITSLLAFAIFHLHGVNGMAGWRWLFLLEGKKASYAHTNTYSNWSQDSSHFSSVLRHSFSCQRRLCRQRHGSAPRAGSLIENSPLSSIVFSGTIPAKVTCTTAKPSPRNDSGMQ